MNQDKTKATQERRDFFISYTAVDRTWAEWIAFTLEEMGYTAVIQVWDSRPGLNFAAMMNDATKQTQRTIAVLSNASVQSDFGFAEWAAAFRRDPSGKLGQLVPVRIEECDVEGLLGPIVYLDLVGLDEAQAKEHLLAGVKKGRAKPLHVAFPGNSLVQLSESLRQDHPTFPGSKTSRIDNTGPVQGQVISDNNAVYQYYTAETKEQEQQKIKLLFLAANPISTSRLAIDEEMRAIERQVQTAKHRDAQLFQSAWAVRPDDLLQLLNQYRPQVVHFSGHGSDTGLSLAGENGQARLVTTRALKALFTTLRDNIRLVVLNACYSQEQGQALVETVDCVIGMKVGIHDDAATVFASSFYRAIGFGRSIQAAFDQGTTSLLLEGIPDEAVPELLVRSGVDARKVILIGARTPFISSSEHKSTQPIGQERVWNIPYPRNPFFTRGTELLTQLAATLHAGQPTALSQFGGLGGIGKTQIAIEYAYQYEQDYQAVLWAQADTRETLTSSFLALAELLNLPEKEASESAQVVAAVKDWLQTASGYLLILDNADDLALARDFLPVKQGGHVLLTTRAQITGRLTHRLEVDKLPVEQGVLFLLRRAGLLAADAAIEQAKEADCVVARRLCEELDGLPLALDQAGAYIEETECGLARYEQRYQHQRGKVLAKRRGELVNDHPLSVATTWKLSFEQVEQQNPIAADLLRACAFLAPALIPETIFTEGASHLGPKLAQVKVDADILDQAVEALRAYSLAWRDAEKQTLSVHRLVQAVLKDQMAEEEQRQWAKRVVYVLHAALPPVEREAWSQWEEILSHAQAAANLIKQYNFTMPEAAFLFNQMGYYLYKRARYQEAEPLYISALAIREQVLGLQHPDTAQSLNNLATLYYEQGKYTQAEPLYMSALAIREQVLGLQHPDTAQSLNNLATLYYEQGKYTQAEPLFVHALAIREQMLGLQHPDTAQSLNNLALLYYEQGKYTQAEPLYVHALAIREQELGPQHPFIATNLNNLAALYESQRKYAQAEPLYVRALAIKEQELGPQHPDTATSLNNLALLYQRQKKYVEAEPLLQRALTIREQQLGSNHPDTAQSLNTLASLYASEGKYTQAELLFQRALYILTQIFSPDNPNVIDARNNLANLYIKRVDIEVIKGNGMLVDKESMLVLRITNRTNELLERLDIELQPSAEYHILQPNSFSIVKLRASSSQEASFRVQVHKSKQIAVNYKINSEMQKEALYIYAIKDNPYVYGDPVREETAFFGRKAECEEIIQAVTKPIKQDILIIGERRIGKTSLLYQVEKHLDLPYVAVSVVLSKSKPTTEDILTLIRRSIISKLVDLKLLDDSWKIYCFPYDDFEDNMKDILKAARVKLDDIKIVLLLDEADYLLQVIMDSFAGTLRSFFGKAPRVDEHLQNILRAALQSEVGARLRAVLASTNDLSTYISNHSSPLFNQFRFLPLKPLSPAETEDLICKPADMLGYKYTSDAVKRIKNLSGGHPYYCQALCYEAFGKVLQSQYNIIGDLEIDYAERNVMNNFRNAYLSGFWGRANKTEKKYLMRLARGYSLSDVTVTQLQRLLDWQIITRVEENIEFSAELFKKWTLQTL